jgi:hypothetical protein
MIAQKIGWKRAKHPSTEDKGGGARPRRARDGREALPERVAAVRSAQFIMNPLIN